MNEKRSLLVPAVVVALIGFVLYSFMSGSTKPRPDEPPQPAPRRPAPPSPEPDVPTPRCPNCPVRPRSASVGSIKSPDGLELLQIDLPGTRHQRNTGGIDGAGLCVFASMRHSGDWQSDPAFYGLFDWMKSKPGGGYPEKVDLMLKAFCAERGYVVPDYFHVRDTDLSVLKMACANGLMPGVGYHQSPSGRYDGQRIAHMVSLVHATDKWFAILDNNYPGESQYEWMTPSEFQRTYAADGVGWSIILLTPPPPPSPHNGD